MFCCIFGNYLIEFKCYFAFQYYSYKIYRVIFPSTYKIYTARTSQTHVYTQFETLIVSYIILTQRFTYIERRKYFSLNKFFQETHFFFKYLFFVIFLFHQMNALTFYLHLHKFRTKERTLT